MTTLQTLPPAPPTAAVVPADPVAPTEAAHGLHRLVVESGVDPRWVAGAGLAVTCVAAVLGGVAFGMVAAVLTVAIAVALTFAARIPAIGLVAMLLASPVLLVELPGSIQVVHLMTVAACAVVCVAVVMRPIPVRIPVALIVAGLFVATIALAAVTSTDAGKSGRVLIDYVLGFGLAISGSIAVAAERTSLVWILRAWVVGSATVIAIALATSGTVEVRFGGALVEGRTTGMFAQPNDFGEFALVALFIGIALVACAANRYDRILGSVAVALALAGVVQSLSRGSWIGLVIGLLALAVLSPRIGAWIAGLAVAGIGFIIAAATIGLPFATGLAARASTVFGGDGNPEDGREMIWAQARQMWSGNQWTGVGPGTYREISGSYGSLIAPDGAYHAHNAVLQFGAEAGVIAVVALILSTVALAVAVGRVCWRPDPARRKGAAVTAALFAGLVAIAGHSIVDFVYTNPVLLMFGWLLFGLTAGAANRTRLGESV